MDDYHRHYNAAVAAHLAIPQAISLAAEADAFA